MASNNLLSHIQMHPKAIVGLLVWLYLADFTAAKCVPERCGSVSVSYPFWIEDLACGYPGFQLKCKSSTNSSGDQPSPFLPTAGRDFEILHINYSGHLIINSTSLKAMSCNGTDDASILFSLPPDGPFTISSLNRFAVIGCRSVGSFGDSNSRGGRCESACLNQYDPTYCNCYGCCEAGIPGNWKSINFTGGGYYFQNLAGACGFSTILDPSTWEVTEKEKCFFARGRYGLRLEWSIGHANCSAAKETPNYSCAAEAECTDGISTDGHLCKCSAGYQGNGYSNGTACTDVNECNYGNECVESPRGICNNLEGYYNCSCAKGYIGDGFQNGTGCQRLTSSNNAITLAIIGSTSSFVGVSLAAFGLFWWLRKRHLKLVKVKYFRHNGGLQLQEYIASRGGRESLRIFSANELEKASENYSEHTKLGSGGYGTVYKGILFDDTLVAIKKSKDISDVHEEDDQFINEVIILSQINHRNVVKLMGCCLETQSPLLVYEFVPNGTLFEHLQSKEEYLRWETRLQIAIESAEALAYLHSAASQPIFHRDVKSSNILLDKRFVPKVADFGISRLLSADDTHLTTNVMGTRGYMDPEYFQTFQLTEKSDVYSFGVVLLELLTALLPLSLERPREDCTLSALFLSRLNYGRLNEILDCKMIKDENQAGMENMAMLARECLQVEGRRRPSMKQVVEELVRIRGATTSHPGERFIGNYDKEPVFDQTRNSREESPHTKYRSHSYPGHMRIEC